MEFITWLFRFAFWRFLRHPQPGEIWVWREVNPFEKSIPMKILEVRSGYVLYELPSGSQSSWTVQQAAASWVVSK